MKQGVFFIGLFSVLNFLRSKECQEKDRSLHMKWWKSVDLLRYRQLFSAGILNHYHRM